MEAFLRDLKHSFRVLRQAPSFTIAAIAALALGIGATTAIFSIVNAVLLKPVPYPDPDRLVILESTFPNGSSPIASPAKFQHWVQETSVLQDVSAFRTNVMNYTGGTFPQQVRAAQVTSAYFHLFGAPVIRGRTFSKEEDLPNGPKVALVSQGLWTRLFGKDPGIVGKTLSLSGDPYVVIGIIGSGFDFAEFGQPPEVWIPFQLNPNATDQGHYFLAAARLKPGVAIEKANARLQVSANEYRRKFPNVLQPKDSFAAQRMQEMLVGGVRQILLVLFGAVSFVLLIACVNVANLLLVRATVRMREFAIRSSIGAGRGHIIRQLLTESVVLSLIGGALGLAFGFMAIRLLLSINTAGLPRVGENGSLVGIDWRVLAFTVVVSVGTGILFGLVPALRGARTALSATLKEGGRTGGAFRQNKARSVLVVVEVALALILLVAAALLIRTSLALSAVNPGFDSENVLTMRMSLTGPRFQKTAAVDQIIRDGTERLRALPGVEQASTTCCIPLEGGYGLPFTIIGRPLQPNTPFHGGGGWGIASSGYFDVFKIQLKRGRAFTDRDGPGAPPVVIISETMARTFWKNADPLKDQILIGRGIMREFDAEPPRQIIGVVSDVRDRGLNNEPGPVMYVPQGQVPDAANALNLSISPLAWVVRTRVRPYSLSNPIQEQIRQATGLPVSEIRTMGEVVSRSTSRERFNMLLMTIFGISALLLAAIGIYGLMSYSVEQRMQEIGVRLALGAQPGQVRKMVLLQGICLAVVGVILGIGSAFALTRFIASFLFGVKQWDPVVFVSIPILLTAVATAAVWVPAIRASRISPLVALRYE